MWGVYYCVQEAQRGSPRKLPKMAQVNNKTVNKLTCKFPSVISKFELTSSARRYAGSTKIHVAKSMVIDASVQAVKAAAKMKAKMTPKMKAKPGEASSSAPADASASSSSTAISDDGWDSADVLVGATAQFVSEKISNLFLKPAKIMAVKGRWVKISPDHLPHSVVVNIEDLDLLPHILENPQIKKGVLSKMDLAEAKLRFGDDLPTLGMDEMLADRHISLGHWIIQRDLPGARGHFLVPPLIVYTFHGAATNGEDHDEVPEMMNKAAAVIKRRFDRTGLLGVPICQAVHWTLLCFRRCASGASVRYYDSLKTPQEDCLKIAQQIVELVMPGTLLTAKSNASVQSNSVDCGVYLLHYWEAEIRRHEGFGWVAPWPQNMKEIKSRKQRLIGILGQIKAFIAAPPPLAKKKVAAPEELPPAMEDEKARIVRMADMKMLSLAALAKKAGDQGTVDFYGCSRCRYIRSGCISYKCNPKKFQDHYAKYPEKYTKGEKDILKASFQKMKIGELIGGGPPQKDPSLSMI